jgi:hypothetical protein
VTTGTLGSRLFFYSAANKLENAFIFSANKLENAFIFSFIFRKCFYFFFQSMLMSTKSHVHFPTIAVLTLVIQVLLPIGGLVHSKRDRKPALSRPQGSPRIQRLLVKKSEQLNRFFSAVLVYKFLTKIDATSTGA